MFTAFNTRKLYKTMKSFLVLCMFKNSSVKEGAWTIPEEGYNLK